MNSPPILLLGDPRLRARADEVSEFGSPALQDCLAQLQAALGAFRARHGFGRAISAPQIGVARRVISLCLAGRSFAIVNPEITWRSEETFTLWDDCMSFPGLLVRLARHSSISLRYQDEHGNSCAWDRLDRGTSELLQHEIDHLDGLLAIDRVIDSDGIVLREVFEADRARFDAQVDHSPSPADPSLPPLDIGAP